MESSVEIIPTKYGRFAVDMLRDKKIGSRLKSGEYHQAETIALLGHFITPLSIVVDIGAHIGTLAIPLSKLASQVIAFEPAPATFALLKQNAELNAAAIDLRNKGLGSEPGSASLDTKNADNAGANTLEIGGGTIEVSTLDSEIALADLIKMDVEGMELSVLEGGRELITTAHPIIFSEINLSALRAHGSSPRKIESFLRAAGYFLYLPLQNKSGHTLLGKIQSIEAVTAFAAPRAWALHGPSAPFDILALPRGYEIPLPQISAASTLLALMRLNIASKLKRFKIL